MADCRFLALVAFVAAAAVGGACALGAEPAGTASAPSAGALKAFDPMLGRWEGEGFVRRIDEEATTAQKGGWLIERAFDGSYVRMEFLAEIGERRSAWVGYFRIEERSEPRDQPVRSVWLNTRSGFQFQEVGAFDASGKTLVLDSVQPRPGGGELKHRSTFTLLGDGRLSVVDEDYNEAQAAWVTTFTFELRRSAAVR